MQDQLIELLPTIIVMALGATGILMKLKSVVKEITDVIVTIGEALADDKVDNAEIQKIIKEAKDVPASLKALISKS